MVLARDHISQDYEQILRELLTAYALVLCQDSVNTLMQTVLLYQLVQAHCSNAVDLALPLCSKNLPKTCLNEPLHTIFVHVVEKVRKILKFTINCIHHCPHNHINSLTVAVALC